MVYADQAAEFLQAFISPEASQVWSGKLFQWKLGAQNPAGPGYLSLAIVNGQVIGTTSITPKRLWIDGKVLIGGEIGDTYTAKQFRHKGTPSDFFLENQDPEAYVNKSVFGRLVWTTRRRAEKDGLFLIYGTPNQSSMPGYVKRLEFFHFNNMISQSFVRARAEWFFKRNPALRLARYAFISIDKLISCMLSAVAVASSPASNIDTAYPSDEAIDELWTRFKPEFKFTVVHDAAWFRFRYLEHPNALYQFVTLHRRGQITGLMVFRSFRDMSGNRVLAVADWLIHPLDKAGFVRLLAEGIKLFSKDVQFVHLWAVEGTIFAKSLFQLGFIRRGEVPLIFATNAIPNYLHAKKEPFDIKIGATDNI